MDLSSSFIRKKYTWHQVGHIATTGFAWAGEKLLTDKELTEFILANSPSFETFKHTVSTLSGDFSIYAKPEHEHWLMCSLSWTFPLFYKQPNDQLFISDDPKFLVNDHHFTPRAFTKNYFLTFGVTPGNQTLHPEIFQIEPGEVLRFTAETQDRQSISIQLANAKTTSLHRSPGELHAHIHSAFKRFSEVIGNRSVLLPLTRGYDSRLLACLLKMFGHTNVICATWGRKGNIEEKTARKVAKQFGFEYHFVNYAEIVPDNFTEDPVFQKYIHYAGHWSSMPYLQDYFAVQHLIKQQIVDQNTIVLSGHMGDFLRGSHLSPELISGNDRKIIRYIRKKFSHHLPFQKTTNETIDDFVVKNFLQLPGNTHWKGAERWDLKERQSKFISNSTSVFRFFGLDVLMPLFDLNLLNFFLNLPFEQRLNSSLYNTCLEQTFFTPLLVDFDLKVQESSSSITDRIKLSLLHLLPHNLKVRLIKMDDAIFYYEMTKNLMQVDSSNDYLHPVKPNSFNAYLVQWYLKQLKEN